MPSRKKNKSNKTKKPSTASAPPAATTAPLAPDTTLGASPANIPSIKAAIASVVASHKLNVQAIIKNNVATIKPTTTKPPSTTAAPPPPEKSTERPTSAKAAPPPASTTTEEPPTILPKNASQPTTITKPSEQKGGEPAGPVEPAAITAPAPAAMVDSHHATTATEAQKPMPVPQAANDVKRQAKKDKLKKKCLIL